MVEEVNGGANPNEGGEKGNKKFAESKDKAIKWAKGALEDVDNFAEKHTKGREFNSDKTQRDEKIVDAVVNGAMKHFSKGKNFEELATAAGYGADDIKNMSKEQRKSLVESFGDALKEDLQRQIQSDDRTKDGKFTERELRSVIRDGLESVSLENVRVTVDKDGKKVAGGADIKGEDGKTDLTKEQNGKTHVNLNDEDGKGKDDNKFYTRAETKLGRAAQTQIGEAVVTAGATAALGVVGLSSLTAGALAAGVVKAVVPKKIAGLAGGVTKLGLDSSVVGTILTQSFANTDEPLSIKGKANDVKENIGDLKDRFLDNFRKGEKKKHHASVLTAGSEAEVEAAAQAKIDERKKERDAKPNETKLADKLDAAVKKVEGVVEKVDVVVNPQPQTEQSEVGKNSVLKPVEVENDKAPKAEIPSFINLPKTPKPEVNDVKVPFKDKQAQLDAESAAQNPTTGKKSFEQVVGNLGSDAEALGEKAINGVADAAKGAANSVAGFFKGIKGRLGGKDNSGGVENATDGNQKIDTSNLMADQSTAGYAIKGEVPKEPSIVPNPFSVKQEPSKNEKMSFSSKLFINDMNDRIANTPDHIDLPTTHDAIKEYYKGKNPSAASENNHGGVEKPAAVVVDNSQKSKQETPSIPSSLTAPSEPVNGVNNKKVQAESFIPQSSKPANDGVTSNQKVEPKEERKETLAKEEKKSAQVNPAIPSSPTAPSEQVVNQATNLANEGIIPATVNNTKTNDATSVVAQTPEASVASGGKGLGVTSSKPSQVTDNVGGNKTTPAEKPAFEVNFNKNGGFEVKNLSGNEAKFKDALQKASGMEPAAFEKAYSYMQDCKFKFSDKAMQDIGGVKGHNAHELAEKQVARDEVSNNPTAAYTAYKDLMGKILDNQGLSIKCEGAVVTKDDAARIVATTGFGNLADKHHKKMENIANGCKDVELSK